MMKYLTPGTFRKSRMLSHLMLQIQIMIPPLMPLTIGLELLLLLNQSGIGSNPFFK